MVCAHGTASASLQLQSSSSPPDEDEHRQAQEGGQDEKPGIAYRLNHTARIAAEQLGEQGHQGAKDGVLHSRKGDTGQAGQNATKAALASPADRLSAEITT